MEKMDNYCKSLWELTRQEAWDELFLCLNVDANATIELASLKIPDQSNDLWLEDHKATLNSLEIILGFILFCDQIFYMLLLLYLLLFVLKFIRFQVITKIQSCLKRFKIYLYRQRCKRNLKYKKM
ncbi:hypothetical protein DOY81_003789 [Sarcophaga bullata]|nr:hypothetical protein DOY81_003789 [Sarcophaga bullata]